MGSRCLTVYLDIRHEESVHFIRCMHLIPRQTEIASSFDSTAESFRVGIGSFGEKICKRCVDPMRGGLYACVLVDAAAVGVKTTVTLTDGEVSLNSYFGSSTRCS
jgi:hypothetical protein